MYSSVWPVYSYFWPGLYGGSEPIISIPQQYTQAMWHHLTGIFEEGTIISLQIFGPGLVNLMALCRYTRMVFFWFPVLRAKARNLPKAWIDVAVDHWFGIRCCKIVS